MHKQGIDLRSPEFMQKKGYAAFKRKRGKKEREKQNEEKSQKKKEENVVRDCTEDAASERERELFL